MTFSGAKNSNWQFCFSFYTWLERIERVEVCAVNRGEVSAHSLEWVAFPWKFEPVYSPSGSASKGGGRLTPQAETSLCCWGVRSSAGRLQAAKDVLAGVTRS